MYACMRTRSPCPVAEMSHAAAAAAAAAIRTISGERPGEAHVQWALPLPLIGKIEAASPRANDGRYIRTARATYAAGEPMPHTTGSNVLFIDR